MELSNPHPHQMDETTTNRPPNNPCTHSRDTSMVQGYDCQGRHTSFQPTITPGMGCSIRQLAWDGMVSTARLILGAMEMKEVKQMLEWSSSRNYGTYLGICGTITIRCFTSPQNIR